MSRWMMGIAGVVVAAVGAWQGDDLAASVADLDRRVTAIEEQLKDRPVGTAEAGGGLRFEGNGDAVSEPFPLARGTALFSYEVAEGYADAELLPAPGSVESSTTPLFTDNAKAAGSHPNGTVAVSIPHEGGNYVVAVRGDATWTVVVEQ